MNEKILLAIASSTALIGLIILAYTVPTAGEGFRLRGTVVEDHGSTSVVVTNVTLIARNVRRGDHVNIPVFWSGESFIAVPEQNTKATE